MNNFREQSNDLGRVQTKVAEPAEPARVYGVAAPFVAAYNGGFHKSKKNWLALQMIPPFALRVGIANHETDHTTHLSKVMVFLVYLILES